MNIKSLNHIPIILILLFTCWFDLPNLPTLILIGIITTYVGIIILKNY